MIFYENFTKGLITTYLKSTYLNYLKYVYSKFHKNQNKKYCYLSAYYVKITYYHF